MDSRKVPQPWMNPEEFKRIRESLRSPRDPLRNLTQLELAAILDTNPMTISRYERGIVEIPKVVAIVMVQLEKGRLTVQQLDTSRYMPVNRII